MNHKRQALERVAFGIAVMFGIYWMYSYLLKQYLTASEGMKTVLGIVALYGVGLGGLLCIIRNIPSATYEKRKVSVKTVLLCLLLQFTAILVLTVLVNIADFIGGNGTQVEIDATSGYMLFMLLVFNPVVEEFVFRKLLADKLLLYGERFYVLVSAFCFALVHGVSLGIPQIMYTFILGAVWAYLFAKTGDIKVVVLMHALSNLFGSVIMQTLMGLSEIAAGMYSLSLIALGILGLVLFLVHRKKVVPDGKPGFFWGTEWKELITNKGIIFYVVLTALMVYFVKFR